ncbi:hypothetical protein Q73_03695 [Bacillus coahuilensis m2-6]|uniref:IDEAL domain-containing protein n=1 Tax=Bacillus coahuilensis TaxID=408580 RepID=UPI000750062C|nr:IDEAL domain-containing protein [Bacillus coahuilensis]KUP09184.1 hypothetical protein Q73_03695 [Bacillus coahuilensis m2-6]
MENKKSYAEMSKDCTMTRNRSTDLTMMEIYVEMVLEELLFHHQKEKLISKIDAALDARDRSLFLQLSSDYKELCTRYDM